MGNEIEQMQSYLIEVAKQTYQNNYTNNFIVFTDAKEDFSYLNYAIPTKSVVDSFNEEYLQIEQIFRENKRRVRFEFLQEFAPSLPLLLQTVGLIEEYRIDFMICTKQSCLLPRGIDNLYVKVINANSISLDLKNFRLVQEISFNEKSTLRLDDIDENDVIERIGNGCGYIGYLQDKPIVASQYTSILRGVTELVGVATLPRYRRRGFGAILSARATQEAFFHGADIVCLSAADENASRLYSKIGFRKIATMLAYKDV